MSNLMTGPQGEPVELTTGLKATDDILQQTALEMADGDEADYVMWLAALYGWFETGKLVVPGIGKPGFEVTGVGK